MSRRIGELLVDAGAVSEVDLRQALAQQKKQGGKPRLGELLLALRKVTPVALAQALADQCKVTYTELPANIPPAISRRLTLEFQKRHQVLPFRKDVVGGVDQIHVAVADPTQKELLEQVQGKFREVLRFYVATPADVAAAIERAGRPPAPATPAPAAAPAKVAPPPAAPAPAVAAQASADPLDELFGGGSASPAPASSGDPLDDLFGGGSPGSAASTAGDPLDELLGGPSAGAAASPGADPLDDLLGGAPSAAPVAGSSGDPLDALLAAPAPAVAAAPPAGDPLEELLGGLPSSAAPTAGDLFDDLLGGAAPAAAAGGADPLDDLLGGAAPSSSSPGSGDPLDDLLGAPEAPAGPHTPLAYVHVFPPRPKPAPPPPAEPAPAAEGPTENEVTPPSGTAFDEVPPEVADQPLEDPALSEEDAWLMQELNRLAAGDPVQADALGTVASVIRMLVRKGVIEQEALLGELGR